ncbi:MAG: Uma2 family endonuclease [Chloroflexota bacterium]
MATESERVILTYDDLVELPNDRNRYELFEGDLQVTAAPNLSHQTAVTNLMVILGNQVRSGRLGWVFTAPFDVLLSDISVVEPDLLFVSRARRGILVPRHVRGAPDLVVEVLSPSTAQVDRGVKRQLYARYGVANYWRVDPDRWEFLAEALADGVYRQVAIARESQTITAPPFPDLVIPLAQVWGWDQE